MQENKEFHEIFLIASQKKETFATWAQKGVIVCVKLRLSMN